MGWSWDYVGRVLPTPRALGCIPAPYKLDVEMHTYHPAAKQWKQEDQEFKVILTGFLQEYKGQGLGYSSEVLFV